MVAPGRRGRRYAPRRTALRPRRHRDASQVRAPQPRPNPQPPPRPGPLHHPPPTHPTPSRGQSFSAFLTFLTPDAAFLCLSGSCEPAQHACNARDASGARRLPPRPAACLCERAHRHRVTSSPPPRPQPHAPPSLALTPPLPSPAYSQDGRGWPQRRERPGLHLGAALRTQAAIAPVPVLNPLPAAHAFVGLTPPPTIHPTPPHPTPTTPIRPLLQDWTQPAGHARHSRGASAL